MKFRDHFDHYNIKFKSLTTLWTLNTCSWLLSFRICRIVLNSCNTLSDSSKVLTANTHCYSSLSEFQGKPVYLGPGYRPDPQGLDKEEEALKRWTVAGPELTVWISLWTEPLFLERLAARWLSLSSASRSTLFSDWRFWKGDDG